ncbi:hypothetical protein [Gaoshiqia sp. Z1-71]|uniref:hypothetical protein n=1 Tax=Gaoshiqia hydrogeniformans TaxID=3290090 RepID=UPI003BF88D90
MEENFTLMNLFYTCQDGFCELGQKLKLEEIGMLKKTGKKKYQPSKRVLQNILDFAKSFNTEETTSIGYVEMNLN